MAVGATTLQAHSSRKLKRYRTIQANRSGCVRNPYHSKTSTKECAIPQIPLGEAGRSESILVPASIETKSSSELQNITNVPGNLFFLSIAFSMSTNNLQASAVPAPQRQMPSTSQNAASPPSKRDLASWWKTFKKNARREEEKGELMSLLR